MFNSIYNQIDRLYIDWDFQYMCNYNCTYCFQKFENKLNTKIDTENNIPYFLNLLKNHKLDFTLGLLGGEPTFDLSKYFMILEYFNNEIFNIKSKSEIYVSTNVSRPLSFYKTHKTYSNVYQWCSLHPEYFNENIFDKLKYLGDSSPQQFIISPMIYGNDISILEKIYDFYLRLDHPNKIYSPQIIFGEDFIKSNILDIDIKNPLYNQSIKEFNHDSNNITLNEFISNSTSFYNKKCYNNYINIDPELNVNGSCFYKHFNIKKNPMDFLNLKPKTIICKEKQCLDYPKILSKKI